MVKRPQISDELVEFVQDLHEEATGTRASSFEQALGTFHRMHHATDGHVGGHQAALGHHAGGGHGGHHAHVNPDEQAVFKTRLDDGRLAVPEPERDALALEDGQLVQVVAYPIEEGERVDSGRAVDDGDE